MNMTSERIKETHIMKAHKFFAWMTVFCFAMTMITGYKKQ